MNRQWLLLLAGLALLQGCASTDREAIPVVDASRPVSEASGRQPSYTGYPATPPQQPAKAPTQDSGVVVMVPQGNNAPLQISSAPITALPTAPAPLAPLSNLPPATPLGVWNAPAQGTAQGTTNTPPPAPSTGFSGAPVAAAPNTPPSPLRNSAGALAADEQLDGPVLALLTTAQQQQGGGDLNGAAASLERAQRIAPREPQVLYRLAQIRLNQGDAAQAEQLSRRALSYAAGRPALQAGLWDLIAQARDKQGDPAGAAQARQRAKVSL